MSSRIKFKNRLQFELVLRYYSRLKQLEFEALIGRNTTQTGKHNRLTTFNTGVDIDRFSAYRLSEAAEDVAFA